MHTPDSGDAWSVFAMKTADISICKQIMTKNRCFCLEHKQNKPIFAIPI